MFTVRLNVTLRSSNAGSRTWVTNVNNQRTFCRIVKLTTSDDERRAIVKIHNNYVPYLNFYTINPLHSLLRTSRLNDESSRNFQMQSARKYSSDSALPRKADVFGDLGGRKFEKFEMDEDEKKEEEFVENEARVFRRHKLTPGGYANLIKASIGKGDLDGALKVLDLVASNRDQPTTYMYNLLLRSYAVAGKLKESRSLYTTMKKRGLKCNDATYTSILNACANYHHSEVALDYLGNLRQEFAEKNIVLNETHYNTMIKAYGRHNNLAEAFAIADEMRDKRLPTDVITFNSLLISSISDSAAGLRHSLIIWHMMQRHRIKPTITTYNLMLRAMRDTKFGHTRLNDILISTPPQCQIILNETTKPNLLEDPPCINSLVFTEIVAKNNKTEEEAGIRKQLPKPDDSETVASSTETNLPATVDSTSGKTSLTSVQPGLMRARLDQIREKNRLILFGGVTGILESMEKNGVTPDVKTMTLLMELVPLSNNAEKEILITARSKKIQLDIDFFNMLMKKRSVRRDYEAAKAILDDIQRNGLVPNIITWGVLALGCKTSEDARNLIDGMKKTGHRLNVVIASTLIKIACQKLRFDYVLEMMETMVYYRIKPNWDLYATLDEFEEKIFDMIKSRKFTRTVGEPKFKAGFTKFRMRYATWQKQMERKDAGGEKKNNANRR